MKQLFQKHGSEHITSLIRAATENGSRTATVSGAWEIDTAIRLPSDFTLILQDCHLRMADGCFSNMFVNEHHGTEIGRTHNGTDHNIAVIGKGRAILDGGEYNGLSESTQMRDGMPPIWKTIFCFLPTWTASELKISPAAINAGGLSISSTVRTDTSAISIFAPATYG